MFSLEALKENLHKIRREMDLLSWVQLISVLTIFLFFMVFPLLTIITRAFTLNGAPSFFWFNLIFSDPYYFGLKFTGIESFPFFSLDIHSTGQILTQVGKTLYVQGIDYGIILNSLIVATYTTIISTVVGTVLAFIMARYEFPGKNIFRIILLVPLISSPFVGAIGIQRMIGENGIINKLLHDILHILPIKIVLDGFAALIFIQVLNFYSIVYLNAYSSFVSIDPSLEEQGENLGAKGFNLFRTITFPLALPGVWAGAILTFILSIEDLGTPVVFKASQAAKTMTFEIFKKIFSPTGDIQEIATALSVILLVVAILGFISIRKYVVLRKYAIVSKGGQRRPRSSKATRNQSILIYTFIISVLSFALIPHIGVFLLSITEYWGNTLLPTKMTLNNYSIIFTNPDIAGSIFNSIVYSSAATLLIIVLGVGAAYIINRKRIPGRNFLDILVTMPVAIPGIVLGIGYFIMFLKTPLSPLINPMPLLILSYTIRKFPFTVRSAYAGLQQTTIEMEEASLNLGASKLRTFLRITLPLIAISVLAGSMLSFVYAMSEVSTSLIFGDVNPTYAPMTWMIKDVLLQLGAGPFFAATLGILLMVVQIIILFISTKLLKQSVTALTGL